MTRAALSTPAPAAQWVTIRQFADFWNVSVRTVWRDIRKGAIPYYTVGTAGAIRIERRVMLAYGRPQR